MQIVYYILASIMFIVVGTIILRVTNKEHEDRIGESMLVVFGGLIWPVAIVALLLVALGVLISWIVSGEKPWKE